MFDEGLLKRLDHPIDTGELKLREFGHTTEMAVKAFQASEGLPLDGRLTEDR